MFSPDAHKLCNKKVQALIRRRAECAASDQSLFFLSLTQLGFPRCCQKYTQARLPIMNIIIYGHTQGYLHTNEMAEQLTRLNRRYARNSIHTVHVTKFSHLTIVTKVTLLLWQVHINNYDTQIQPD